MVDYFLLANELYEYTRSLRRDFHKHPELGFREVRTAGIVAQELRKLGLEVSTGIAETGVVALLEGSAPGPTLLIRFDMDALPVEEQTGVEYASAHPGLMHACGHDGHVAVGLTVARILTSLRENIHGTIKLVFQPAEEGMGGAERMIEAGILENPKVDTTLSMHLWNTLPVGNVSVTPGAIMAGADIFSVRIEGRGGHGALPHETTDPLMTAVQIISTLQTVVSRNVSPFDAAVVSVCMVKAGDAFNVIPQTAEFQGTFRTFHPDVRQKVVERFEHLVTGLARAMDCVATVDLKKLTPAVINDAHLTEVIHQTVQEKFPNLHVLSTYQSMVSEDMAFMMEKAPGCYLLIGSGKSSPEDNYGHHHPKFNIQEEALPIAVAVVSASAMAILK